MIGKVFQLHGSNKAGPVWVPAWVVCFHCCSFDINPHVTPAGEIVISLVVDHGVLMMMVVVLMVLVVLV